MTVHSNAPILRKFIAAVLAISRQQYQLYESGKREMPMHLFVILARYYNVTLDYLAGLIDTPRKIEP